MIVSHSDRGCVPGGTRRDKASMKVREYYDAKHGTPYKHWQNSVEWDIQTMIHNNISAVVHVSLLMRTDSRNRALKHWIKRRNDDLHQEPTRILSERRQKRNEGRMKSTGNELTSGSQTSPRPATEVSEQDSDDSDSVGEDNAH
eukprot:gene28631-37837_t